MGYNTYYYHHKECFSINPSINYEFPRFKPTLSSFSIPSTYEAEVTIVLFLINNYLDVLPQ